MATQPELYRPLASRDLLSLPVIRRVARWRYGRLMLQILFLLVAALLVYDGLTGPQRAAENLATVVPWVHYRGLIVLALLMVGNLFCMGCPFTLPRTLAKRISVGGRRFPRALRNKWLAIVSLFVMFFLYEYLDMWSGPALTAWVIVAYFLASFALESIFTESAFCKYVCPLGTFNFIYSTASPTQITAHNMDICRECVGKKCVSGSYNTEQFIRVDQIPTAEGGTTENTVTHGPEGTLGCGTLLFVPQMKTNLDCTLCLDCVRACPHDNVVLAVRTPGRELLQPDSWPKRWDVTLLAVGLAFMAIVNAFGMVPPVYDLMQDMAPMLGLVALGLPDRVIEFIVLLIIFVISALLLPTALVLGAAHLTGVMTRTRRKYPLREVAASFAPAFVPVGFGIWIAHYGFHFLAGALSIIPVFHNFLIDHHITVFGSSPDWALGGIEDFSVIGLVQVVALMGGFLWSMLVAQRVALRLYRRQAMAALLPWALILLGLAAAATWIFGLDMEMRGTILFH
jgi:polyferredoxin